MEFFQKDYTFYSASPQSLNTKRIALSILPKPTVVNDIHSITTKRVDLPPCSEPRIIIEDVAGRYRATFKVFPKIAGKNTYPVIDWNHHGEGSPFIGNHQQADASKRIKTALRTVTIARPVAAAAAAVSSSSCFDVVPIKPTYCEVCVTDFDGDQWKHFITKKHQEYN